MCRRRSRFRPRLVATAYGFVWVVLARLCVDAGEAAATVETELAELAAAEPLMGIGIPTAGHFIYIPAVLLIGIVIGWILGSRAAQDALADRRSENRDRASRQRSALSCFRPALTEGGSEDPPLPSQRQALRQGPPAVPLPRSAPAPSRSGSRRERSSSHAASCRPARSPPWVAVARLTNRPWVDQIRGSLCTRRNGQRPFVISGGQTKLAVRQMVADLDVRVAEQAERPVATRSARAARRDRRRRRRPRRTAPRGRSR